MIVVVFDALSAEYASETGQAATLHVAAALAPRLAMLALALATAIGSGIRAAANVDCRIQPTVVPTLEG